jgi:hypothetical protein
MVRALLPGAGRVLLGVIVVVLAPFWIAGLAIGSVLAFLYEVGDALCDHTRGQP